MLKVFHIIPSDALGGVEVAAIRAERKIKELMSYELYIISPRTNGKLKKLLNLLKYLQTIFKESNPIIVTSLWPSHVLGLFISIFKSDADWVPFYHSSVHFGLLDSIFSRLSIWKCSEALVDSRITKEFVRSFAPQLSLRVVPYILDVIKIDDYKEAPGLKSIDFIWVGRDDINKHLVGFVEFCEYLENIGIEAYIVVISSNNIQSDLLARISKIKMISVYGELSWEETQYYLSKAKLLMCTSFKEGFSMVAYEGLSHGCLPCGSMVGEVHQIINTNAPNIYDYTADSFQRFYLEAVPFLRHEYKRIKTVDYCVRLLEAQYPEDYVQSFSRHIKVIAS
jgi:hypothetical protein